jgi:hypothetical protein
MKMNLVFGVTKSNQEYFKDIEKKFLTFSSHSDGWYVQDVDSGNYIRQRPVDREERYNYNDCYVLWNGFFIDYSVLQDGECKFKGDEVVERTVVCTLDRLNLIGCLKDNIKFNSHDRELRDFLYHATRFLIHSRRSGKEFLFKLIFQDGEELK